MKIPVLQSIEATLLVVKEIPAENRPMNVGPKMEVQSHSGTWFNRTEPHVVQLVTDTGNRRLITPFDVEDQPLVIYSHLGGGGAIELPSGITVSPAHAWAEYCNPEAVVAHLHEPYPAVRSPMRSAKLGSLEVSPLGNRKYEANIGDEIEVGGLDTVGTWLFLCNVLANGSGPVQIANRLGSSILEKESA